MKKISLFLFPLIALTLFFAFSAHATLIESGIPGGGSSSGLQPGNTADTIGQDVITPAQYVRYLYLFVMGFVGIAGLVTLIIWGTVWTASGVVDKKAAAMEGIKNTLYGIGVALTAYILLYTINPDLTILKTPSLTVDTTPIQGPSCQPLNSTILTTCASGITKIECLWVSGAVKDCSAVLGSPSAFNGKASDCSVTGSLLPSCTYTCCEIPL